MKNEVSALMDGELENHEAAQVIAALKNDSQLRKDWETYHLISDAIRYETKPFSQYSQATHNRRITGPTPISSVPTKYNNRKTYTLAIAASVVAAVITTWFSLQNIDQVGPSTIIANQKEDTAKPLPAVTSITAPSINAGSALLAHPLAPAAIDDYLFVHKEFLPGAVTHNQPMYVHPVTNSSESYGR